MTKRSIFEGIGRDFGYHRLLAPADYDRALIALREVVDATRQHGVRRQAQFDQLKAARDAATEENEHLAAHAELNETVHQSSYEDAAFSHAIVGGLAPFFEGLFKTGFSRLWQKAPADTKDKLRRNGHIRWKASQPKWPDPTLYVKPRGQAERAFARGVEQVLEAFEIRPVFPADIHEVISALFEFRNAALHNGFEWPAKKRREFDDKVKQRQWDTWFDRWESSEGTRKEPWIFLLSPSFIDTCLDRARQCLDGFSGARKMLNVAV